MTGTTDLAIVGAGAAGAGAAYALRDADVEVTVYEKSAGVCGRAATRRRDGCRYDYGANYVKPEDERVNDLLRSLGTEGLVDIEAPVWTFDAGGTVSEGRDDEAHKWTWREGITQLAKRLFGRSDAAVERETPVADLVREPGGWRLRTDGGRDLGVHDAVLLTPPGPQTARLLRDADWAADLRDDLAETAGAVPYRTVATVVLHYPFREAYPYYALVNTDREHEVGWLAREECKDGHVPAGESLLVVQMAPDWSGANYDRPLAEKAAVAADHATDLLGDDRRRDFDWADEQGWRYALPDGGADRSTLDRGADHGLYFAGDWVAGAPRVHAALASGLETGERVAREA